MNAQHLMLRASIALLGFSVAWGAESNPVVAADADHPFVVLDTSAGAITLELDRTKAPISVDNFLKYVDKGYYDGLIFHRVIDGFMVQGGGMTEVSGKLNEKGDTFPPIKNESATGLSNTRGTLAMARTSRPNSATCQFFINLADNSRLDAAGGGYTAFGKVIDGMNVVDAIAKMPVTSKIDQRGEPNGDVPVKIVTIKTARRKN